MHVQEKGLLSILCEIRKSVLLRESTLQSGLYSLSMLANFVRLANDYVDDKSFSLFAGQVYAEQTCEARLCFLAEPNQK